MRNNYFKATISMVMLTLFSFTGLIAQNISGVVNDENGEPLPGASVLVVGTTNGTTTDFDGNFSIDISDDQATNGQFTLSASFMGYQNAEKAFSVGSDQTWSPQLQPDASILEDVVVIGYGTVKKEDATGSVSAISAKDFNPGAITSPQDLMNGKISGVQITNSGGAPGAGSTIRIRGGSSLSASNDPLIVIDGVPIDSEGVSGMQNPLNTINPDDIDTFTVLKDASATAIYGSRASNGVIIITTKQGKVGGKLKVDYSGRFSLNTVPNKVNVLDATEYRKMVKTKLGDDAYNDLGDASTDWQDEILGSSFGMDHNISLSGSTANMPYRVSIGYSDQDGILATSNLKRTTASVNLNPSFLDDKLKISVSLKGVNVKNRFGDTGAIGSAVGFDPTRPVKDGSAWDKGYFTWLSGGNPTSNVARNPVAMLELKNDESNVNRAIGNFKVDYELPFLPELKLTLNTGIDYSESDGDNISDPDASWTYPDNESRRHYEQTKKNELLDVYAQYVKDLDNIESTIDVMAGYSWQHFYRDGSDLGLNNANDTTKNFTYATESYLVSFFGRVNYTLKNKYLFTFTVRQDGTSRFSKDTRQGIFPAAAFAWKMKEETFLKDVEVLSDLKLRLGWGVTGQQNIGQGDYPYLAVYENGENSARAQIGYNADGTPRFVNTIRANGYDSQLKWEETTTYNIGVDYGFLNGRVRGLVDVYYRETTDLLNRTPVAALSNLTDIVLTNVGNLENRGVELELNGAIIQKDDLHWSMGINATYNKNKITKLQTVDNPDYDGVYVGGINGGTGINAQVHSVGYSTNTFFVLEQIYNADGKPIEGAFVDQNEDGEINEKDRIRYNDPNADWSFGINSNLSYKNWDFSFSGRMRLGNYVYNNVDSNNGTYDRLFMNAAYGNITTDIYNTEFQTANTNQKWSNYYVQDASFFRMDNIMIGYNFNELFGGTVNARVSATVNNAFIITGYEGLDPEVDGGIDNNVYPRPRVFTLGVNLSF